MSTPEPRSVAAGHGTKWLGEGYALFRRGPGTWVGITLIWFVISAVLGAIPGGIGELVGMFLNPVFQAGLVLGCAALVRQEPLKVEHLFAGFRGGHLGQLLLMSVIELGLAFVALLVGVLTVAGTVKGLVTGGDLHTIDPVSGLLAVLIVLALILPLLMLVWFAPALIVLDRLPAWEAMKLSLRACLRNVVPFLVYGLVAVAILIVACIPLLLGLLVAVPVLWASVYTSYRDVFHPPS